MSTRWPQDQQAAGPHSEDEDPWAAAGGQGQPQRGQPPSGPPSGQTPADEPAGGRSPGRPSRGQIGRRGRRSQAEDQESPPGDDEDLEWIHYLTGGRSSSAGPSGGGAGSPGAARPAVGPGDRKSVV